MDPARDRAALDFSRESSELRAPWSADRPMQNPPSRRDRMRSHIPFALLGVALAAPPLLSCDDVTVGQLAPDPGPPVLMKILIQDATQPGRQAATDLLDKKPTRTCSDTDPC